MAVVARSPDRATGPAEGPLWLFDGRISDDKVGKPSTVGRAKGDLRSESVGTRVISGHWGVVLEIPRVAFSRARRRTVLRLGGVRRRRYRNTMICAGSTTSTIGHGRFVWILPLMRSVWPR